LEKATILKSAGKIVIQLFLYGCVAASLLFRAGAQQKGADSPRESPAAKGVENVSPNSNTPDTQEIIRRFAAKEKEFKTARDNYTYRQIVKVEELGMNGDVGGTYQIQEDVIFTPSGERIEKVVYAPMSTLRHIGLSPEDEKDLRSIQPFVLTTDDLTKYDIQYQGRQKVDEITTFVFRVGPKTIEKGQRYFEGQIWVDDRDFQIVKSYGKAVPDIRKKGQENLFPRFETYREQIDGKYWFPTWTGADDTLHFSTGAQRIRMIVKYENYKQFRSNVKVTYGEEVPQQKPKP
jgi:hypothetical protein